MKEEYIAIPDILIRIKEKKITEENKKITCRKLIDLDLASPIPSQASFKKVSHLRKHE